MFKSFNRHGLDHHHQVRGPRQGGEVPGEEAGCGEPDQAQVGEQTEPRQCHHQSGQSAVEYLEVRGDILGI